MPAEASNKKSFNTIFSIFMATVSLAVMFIVFFLPDCKREQLLETGLPGSGVILAIRDTGNRYNSQPEVELMVDVTPQEGGSYRATTTMVISPVYLPQFQPGSKVKIRYDAANRENIAIESTMP